jgi:phosphoribosylaminoimidazolecarboxamide formyltransferase / IMP cyclohydrolase
MRAIITVSDKTDVVKLSNFLLKNDFTIYSTGGTFREISDNVNINYQNRVLQVSDLTHFPEILNGRVKTLHPHIYAGVLADSSCQEHSIDMQMMDLPYFDVVVCNLYPFKKENTIENIDIGGVSLIRAGSKNFTNIVVLSDVNQYDHFMENFNAEDKDLLGIDIETRSHLAMKGFQMTSDYDNCIYRYVGGLGENYHKLALKYGMNPQQSDACVEFDTSRERKAFNVINGTLGAINVLDMLHGWLTVMELDDRLNLPAAISMKHTSLAGLAVGNGISDYTLRYFGFDSNAAVNLGHLAMAYMKSRLGDPLSSFGDFIVLSRECDLETAQLIKREVCDGIAAPGYSPEALEILQAKKSGKFIIVKMDMDYYRNITQTGWGENKEIYGVKVCQRNNGELPDFSSVADVNLRIDYTVANAALRYAQSNNISIAVGGQVIGMGCGQQNRVGCVKLAGEKAQNWETRQTEKCVKYWDTLEGKRQEKVNHLYEYIDAGLTFIEEPDTKIRVQIENTSGELVLASDGFFPFTDNIEVANGYNIKHIIHPGGSMADASVEEKCKEYGITMFTTGVRMFYH